MAALRRTWVAVLLGLLAVVGIACSGGSSTSESRSRTTDAGTTVERGNGGGITPQGTGGAKQDAKPSGGAVKGPADDGVACAQCQSSEDTVKLSDADGFEFETGSAEAGRIDADKPAAGDEKPATFDAGGGLKGTTGSSNLRPK